MSTDNDSDITLFYEQSVINDYMGFVGITFLILDWALNLDREIGMFWKRPQSVAPLLYFANRWILLVVSVITVVARFATASNTCVLVYLYCNVLVLTAYAFACIQYLPVAFFSAMRAYGLLKNIVLACLILFLSLVPLGTNLVAYRAGIQGEIVPLIGCLQSAAFPQELYIGLIFTTRLCLMVADIFLIIVTWRVTPRRGMIPNIPRIQRKGLVGVIYRDGLVYFVVLLVVNTLDLLFSVLPAFNVAVNVNFMLQLIQPLTSILISHFLLDLQEAYRRTLRLNSDDPLYTEASIGGDQQLGSLNFAHVVGSLGAVIDHSATGEDLVVGEGE